MQWFKHDNDTRNDPKLALIAQKTDLKRSTVYAIWCALMECAAANKERGSITEIDWEAFAFSLDETEEDVSKVVECMKTLKRPMVCDGILPAFVKRNETSTDRVRKSRAKKQNETDETVSSVTDDSETDGNTEKRMKPHRGEEKRREENKNTLPSEESVRLAFGLFATLAEQNNLSVPQRLTDARKRKLRRRLKDCGGLDGWAAALKRLTASDYCMGRVKNWRADFDFLLQEKSFTKLMEGGYDNRTANDTTTRRSAIAESLGLGPENLDREHGPAEVCNTGGVEGGGESACDVDPPRGGAGVRGSDGQAVRVCGGVQHQSGPGEAGSDLPGGTGQTTGGLGSEGDPVSDGSVEIREPVTDAGGDVGAGQDRVGRAQSGAITGSVCAAETPATEAEKATDRGAERGTGQDSEALEIPPFLDRKHPNCVVSLDQTERAHG